MDRISLYQANNQAYKTADAQKKSQILGGPDRGDFRMQAVTIIPVVVHIVLPNPFLVTNADVQAQIDRLNLDFAGLNPDSSNATNFYGVRGHSGIQFCLARRTPDGQLTNGIERRPSSVGSNAFAIIDPIKRTSLGGLDAWNANQYLNLWVGSDASGQSVLGYASDIGPGTAADDGVFLNYQSFGFSSCYVLPGYDRGRTATHELGHYFGLYHIWGEDEGCADDDFKQLPSSTSCSLPNGLFNPTGQGNGASDVGDTPNQTNETTTCPSGTALDACSNASPGKMYQDFMDYTQDACLSMFTKKQVSRMEWVLDNCRAGLKSSSGCQPPAGALTLDAAVLSAVAPGGFELSGCKTVYHPDTLSCAGNITPKLRIGNSGLNTLTSLTLNYSYDNGPLVSKTVSLNLLQGEYTVVAFDPAFVNKGTHTFRFFTSLPNGNTDQNTANDSYTATITVLSPTALPIAENFDAPLTNAVWTIDNPDIDFTWQRTTPGRDGSAGKLSIDNFGEDGSRNVDDFRSTAITVDPTSAYVLSFDLAYRYFPDPENYDSLAVLVSSDCGQTFTRIYYKGGPSLATAGSLNTEYTQPEEDDWRTEKVNIGAPLLASGEIIVVFRNISAYGNWLHLDNIALNSTTPRDLQVVAVQQPRDFVCTGSTTPVVSVRNLGVDTVQSVTLLYQVNGGAAVTKTVSGLRLAKGEESNVTLPSITGLAPGNFDLLVYSNALVTANGAGDLNAKNDTVRYRFTVPTTLSAPLQESFAGTAFPPAGWTVLNNDTSFTWQRYANGNGGSGSAYVNTFGYSTLNQRDELVTPLVSYPAVDSVSLSFDVAASLPDAIVAFDTLEVLVTADCGNNFSPVYKKWGADLQTVSTSQTDAFFPAAGSDWRHETIDLTAFANKAPIQVFFRLVANRGNNVFLDNINLSTRVLPATLKQQGYLVYPSPFSNSFTVWHYQTPTALRYIKVMNMAGQTILVKGYSGNAAKQEPIDLTGKAAGMYVVQLYYSDSRKTVTQRIIKN